MLSPSGDNSIEAAVEGSKLMFPNVTEVDPFHLDKARGSERFHPGGVK
jgi:hypothetical protein